LSTFAEVTVKIKLVYILDTRGITNNTNSILILHLTGYHSDSWKMFYRGEHRTTKQSETRDNIGSKNVQCHFQQHKKLTASRYCAFSDWQETEHNFATVFWLWLSTSQSIQQSKHFYKVVCAEQILHLIYKLFSFAFV